jgi:Phosphotransferase enzyme family
LAGRDVELPREIERVKEASDAFHSCIRYLPRPDFIDDRDDPWAFGDRLAWEGDQPQGDEATLAVIERLRDRLQPVSTPSQVIHGDILPNVLVKRGSALGVIDWPPYFRPEGMANAIAVTDAVTFRGAPMSLLDEWSRGEDWNQLLIRSLLYRLGPTGVFATRNRLMGRLKSHVHQVGPVVDAVLAS